MSAPALGAKRAAAAAVRLRIRVVEDEAFADQAHVVIKDGAVQVQQALLVDVDLGPRRPFEDFITETRVLLPRKGIAQARAPAAFDANAQPAVVNALLGHQRADLARRRLCDLDHFLNLRWGPTPSACACAFARSRSLGIATHDFPLSQRRSPLLASLARLPKPRVRPGRSRVPMWLCPRPASSCSR